MYDRINIESVYDNGEHNHKVTLDDNKRNPNNDYDKSIVTENSNLIKNIQKVNETLLCPDKRKIEITIFTK